MSIKEIKEGDDVIYSYIEGKACVCIVAEVFKQDGVLGIEVVKEELIEFIPVDDKMIKILYEEDLPKGTIH
jgi:hypothetical protein